MLKENIREIKNEIYALQTSREDKSKENVIHIAEYKASRRHKKEKT